MIEPIDMQKMKKIIIFVGLEEGKEKYQLFINNTLISRKEDCYYQGESMDRASEAFAEVIAITFQTYPGTYPMNIRNGEKAELDASGDIQVRDIQKLEQDLIYSFAENLSHKLKEFIGESRPVLNLWGMRN